MPQIPRNQWDCLSPDYFNRVLTPFSNDHSIEQFFKMSLLCDTLGKVLDAGCGNGYFLQELLSRHVCQSKPVAVDFSGKMLENAKVRLGDSVQLLCSGIHELPFGSNSFDHVFAINSIIDDERCKRERALKELYRVLHLSGLLILILPSLESYWEQLHVAREMLITEGLDEKQAVWDVYDQINTRLFDPIGGYINIENSALRIKLYSEWEIKKITTAIGFTDVTINRYIYSLEHCTQHNLICSENGLFDWFVIARKS